MDDRELDFLFDEKIKNNIKNSFNDISFDENLKDKIKAKVLNKKSLKDKIVDLLNYEVEIPIGKIGIVAALLAIIPATFTIYEGKKILNNNIRLQSDNVTYSNIETNNGNE
ncbi:Uncharacterised protein [uncultured Clostridium sp.]|uniref:hypothetical protein n=1 Tax=uncultured Clostridium sp. TaxID=59620 RepID=UPI0008205ABA|nr:hypothetical protein [uncultured Clostridium sp.]SCJ97528.1 Uncharacterised protein [uncultured Clostridium sp.]